MSFDIIYNSYTIRAHFNYWQYLPYKTLAYFEIRYPDDTGTIEVTLKEAMRFVDAEVAARNDIQHNL